MAERFVRALELQSGGPEFKSHHLDLFSATPLSSSAILVNSQQFREETDEVPSSVCN